MRFEVEPSTVVPMAGCQSFFPLGVDKTISRVSVYDAYFVPGTYVPVKIVCFCALSHEHTAHRTYTTGRQQNIRRARRYNAAARKHPQATPCVCDKPICPVLLWLQQLLQLCSSEPGVRNAQSIPTSLSAAAVCKRSTLAVVGKVRITRTLRGGPLWRPAASLVGCMRCQVL